MRLIDYLREKIRFYGSRRRNSRSGVFVITKEDSKRMARDRSKRRRQGLGYLTYGEQGSQTTERRYDK